MDDFHFFYKIRNEITFLNVKELKIFHDRYPDNYNKFFKYKYKNRFRTGEKVITHPGIYLKIPIIYILFLLPAILIYLIIYYKLKTILLIIITLTIGYFTFLSIYFLNNDIKKIVNFTEFIKIIVGLHSTIFIGFYNGFIYKIFYKLLKLLKII